MKLKSILLFIFLNFILIQCSDPKKEEDLLPLLFLLGTPTPVSINVEDPDFIRPNINTANMRLGGNNVLRNIDPCPNGSVNLGNPFDLPTLYIMNADLSLNSGVLLRENGSFVLNIDLDGQSVYSPSAPCPVNIIENSATAYDIQVKGCALKKNPVTSPAPPTNTVSFRALCSKV
ncbi:hypothetical protein A0128_13870 [Leptospira tipperaryensis]|uniref:Uncharacterized protein n=1 Tax=Leptospira tipperaryensis TaxID=2564040 RepID=A0A1D7UZ26_9LEPT|nr:hypothetical protein [Leptospira tipperaryensis]AOP34839.1 hypothetical protein A0128_13870 [Leptospira tipperaryensis]